MTDLALLPSPHLTSPGSSSHAPHLSERHVKQAGCGQGCTSLTAGHSTPFRLAATFTSRSRSLKPCVGISAEMSTQLCGLQMLHSDHGPTSQSLGHGTSHLKIHSSIAKVSLKYQNALTFAQLGGNRVCCTTLQQQVCRPGFRRTSEFATARLLRMQQVKKTPTNHLWSLDRDSTSSASSDTLMRKVNHL